jgi:hypothetical protein
MNALLRNPISATRSRYVTDLTSTSSGTTIPVGGPGAQISPRRSLSPKSIEEAVFAYLQAKRALGAVQISSEEIARALGLAQSVVKPTLVKLISRGVKLK